VLEAVVLAPNAEPPKANPVVEEVVGAVAPNKPGVVVLPGVPNPLKALVGAGAPKVLAAACGVPNAKDIFKHD
jgi:molybdopterin-biosynthesis enzyme MoeA-like protein